MIDHLSELNVANINAATATIPIMISERIIFITLLRILCFFFFLPFFNFSLAIKALTFFGFLYVLSSNSSSPFSLLFVFLFLLILRFFSLNLFSEFLLLTLKGTSISSSSSDFSSTLSSLSAFSSFFSSESLDLTISISSDSKSSSLASSLYFLAFSISLIFIEIVSSVAFDSANSLSKSSVS